MGLPVRRKAFVGQRGRTIRAAPGTSSCRSSSRFDVNSPANQLIPVRLPPGAGKACDKTKGDRVFRGGEDDRRNGDASQPSRYEQAVCNAAAKGVIRDFGGPRPPSPGPDDWRSDRDSG
jgi:hypothetical protein